MTSARHAIRPLPAFAMMCVIIVFLSMLVGWRLLPEHINGLYSITDGNYTRWNYEYAFAWGRWFELSNFNPFSGLGSTFWTNTPWLNPGAWALELPLPTQTAITVSYLVHLLLFWASLYCLGRVAGASRLAILFCGLVFVVMFFPPFTMYWNTIIHVSVAPFRLLTMAASNLMICSMVIAAYGKQRRAFAIALTVGVAALIWGVYASATYFVFDLLVIGGFFVVLLLSAPNRLRLLALGMLIAAVFVLMGVAGYIDALVAVSVRPRPRFADLLNGLEALIFDDAVRASFLASLSSCKGLMVRYLPCIGQPSFPFFALSLVAAACGTRSANASFRTLSIYSILLQLCLWFLSAAELIKLFGSFHAVAAVQHIAFAASVFTVLPFMIAADWLLRARQAFAWPMFLVPAAAAVAITLLVVIPHPYVRNYPSVLAAIIYGGYKGDAETPIIRYLRQHVGLQPGATFRGSVATYLGQSETMTKLWAETDRYRKIQNSPMFLFIATQNPHQNTGLWEADIPTYDEYAHMVTKTLMRFTSKLLSNGPFDVRTIRAYEIRPEILRMVGVRYVLSDGRLDIPGLTEVERLQTGGYWDVKLFLYQLDGTNLGTWSPDRGCRLGRRREIAGRNELRSAVTAHEGVSFLTTARRRSRGHETRLVVVRHQRVSLPGRKQRMVPRPAAAAILALLEAGRCVRRQPSRACQLLHDRADFQGNG